MSQRTLHARTFDGSTRSLDASTTTAHNRVVRRTIGILGGRAMPYHITPDGVPLYYLDEGQGAPVILIYGWTMNHKFFGLS